MIFYAKDRTASVREKVWDGEGEVHGLNAISANSRPENSCVQMIAENTLPKGASIGFHIHHENEEIYIVTKGQALFIDNDKQEYILNPGDSTLTRRGEGHAIAQHGDEPMTFLAVIAA